jgi:hypothetical protein
MEFRERINGIFGPAESARFGSMNGGRKWNAGAKLPRAIRMNLTKQWEKTFDQRTATNSAIILNSSSSAPSMIIGE